MRGIKQIFVSTVLLFLMFLSVLATGSEIIVKVPINENTVLASNEKIDYDVGIQKADYTNLSISSPYSTVCSWSDPKSGWKECETIIEINNTKDDLLLKGDVFSIDFERDVKDLKISASTSYNLVKNRVLNKTCYFDLVYNSTNLSHILTKENGDNQCYYDVMTKVFDNFTNITEIDKIANDSVLAVKLEFSTPIEVKEGQYLRNYFNFTLLGDKDYVLDPEISDCAVLNTVGGNYSLTADIINSNIQVCMNITADNVTLDCQGHLIGTLGLPGNMYGVAVNGVDNITIKNCAASMWPVCSFNVMNSNNTKVINSTVDSGPFCSICLIEDNNSQVINSNVTNSEHGATIFNSSDSQNAIINSYGISNWAGFGLVFADNGQIINSTAIGNDFGVTFVYNSSNNSVYGSVIKDSLYFGIGYFYSEDSSYNYVYNNLINNTANFGLAGTPPSQQNNWNTTSQVGTRIYSKGVNISGNYWTNSTNNGYSDTCTDSDYDGYCDASLVLMGNNTDYLPLSDEYRRSDIRWYVNQTSIPAEYNPNVLTQFNMTWNVSNRTAVLVNISKVFLYTNCTGSEVNYTMNNATYGGDIFNLSLVLPACNVSYWYSKANNTDNDWNTSTTWYFNISKNASNTIQLNMSKSNFTANYTNSNITVYSNVIVNISAWFDFTDSGSIVVYSDEVLITNPYGNTVGLGAHAIKANTSGNQNYTSNATGLTYYLISAPTPGSGGGGATIYENITNITNITQPYCGDGICSEGETIENCPLDCKPAEFGLVPTLEIVIVAIAVIYVLWGQSKYSSKKRKWEI